ncbi:nucleotide pyrophosphohydrolase [Archaeoglobales archaeon ex4484_92]|nr:MAG: nucleotide pyrophosphohydrolase [Archaeoglobales archaeon ex4484_92]
MVTIKDITKMILQFRDERDWKSYHTPRNLAISLIAEVGELFEHFQWRTDEEILQYVKDKEKNEKVAEELADIAIYLLLLANELGVNLEKAVIDKIEKNKKKYPVELVRGKYLKYSELSKDDNR